MIVIFHIYLYNVEFCYQSKNMYSLGLANLPNVTFLLDVVCNAQEYISFYGVTIYSPSFV